MKIAIHQCIVDILHLRLFIYEMKIRSAITDPHDGVDCQNRKIKRERKNLATKKKKSEMISLLSQSSTFLFVLVFAEIGSRSSSIEYMSWAKSNETMDSEAVVFEELRAAWEFSDWFKIYHLQPKVFELIKLVSFGRRPPVLDLSNSSVSPCKWSGVTCDSKGRAIKIILSEKSIRGTIPASIGKLNQLEQLYLYKNSITGVIPEQLGELKMLTHLSLGENLLVGSIPSQLGDMYSLVYLYLFGNKLEGTIPESIGNLGNLSDLGLWSNQLEGSIPSELSKLKGMRYLALNNNNFSGQIPPSLFLEMPKVCSF